MIWEHFETEYTSVDYTLHADRQPCFRDTKKNDPLNLLKIENENPKRERTATFRQLIWDKNDWLKFICNRFCSAVVNLIQL